MVGLLTETDPQALIPGDADQVIEVARRIRVLADQGLRPVAGGLEQAAARLEAATTERETHRRLQARRSFWYAQADILDSLATAFERYAVAIRTAQASAAHAAQAAAWARAAVPYPAAWTAYGQAATELRAAQVRLGEAADLLADAVERATETLPDGATPDGASPDGATPDGASPDGASPDGASPDGATPDHQDVDWPRLGREALQVADELAAIVAGGLLAAVGLGAGVGGGPLPPTAAVLPRIVLADIALTDLAPQDLAPQDLAFVRGRDPVPDTTVVAALLTARLRQAVLPDDGPAWDDVEHMTWAQVKVLARTDAGFRTVRKLLERVRWDG